MPDKTRNRDRCIMEMTRSLYQSIQKAGGAGVCINLGMTVAEMIGILAQNGIRFKHVKSIEPFEVDKSSAEEACEELNKMEKLRSPYDRDY